jgi:hypothetical protein
MDWIHRRNLELFEDLGMRNTPQDESNGLQLNNRLRKDGFLGGLRN